MIARKKYFLTAIIQLMFLLLINLLCLHAQPSKFVIMTDSRGDDIGVNTPVLSKIINHINSNHGDIKFLIFPGDMVSGNKIYPDSTYIQMLHWKDVMRPLYDNPGLIPPKIFITEGNHEIQTRFDENNLRKVFPDMPQNGPDDEKGLTYSFDFGKVHFAVIASNRWYYGNPADTTDDRRDWRYIRHLDWLENDIKKAKENGSEMIFVLSHEPVFPAGGHLRDGLPNLRKDLKLPLDSIRLVYFNRRNEFWKLLKDNGVSAYICGHEHLYARQTVDGVMHITAGSSGAPLYNFNPKYGEGKDEKTETEKEMSYEDALPYYKTLNYDYGETGNCQASPDFFGLKVFHYILFEAGETGLKAVVYGAYPKKGTDDELGSEITILDEFLILPR
jgi:hypothetical protein